MNFLKELSKRFKKKTFVSKSKDVIISRKYLYIAEVEEITKELWRSFWEKKRKEIEKRLSACEIIKSQWMSESLRIKMKMLKKELSWIEKQLKEVNK